MKNKNGITLIALIITIIVLLILAGVSIALVVGDNGIATKAQKAKKDTTLEQAREQLRIAVSTAYTNGEGKIYYDDLNDELYKEFGNNYTISDEDAEEWVITVTTTEGNVTEIVQGFRIDIAEEIRAYFQNVENENIRNPIPMNITLASGTAIEYMGLDYWENAFFVLVGNDIYEAFVNYDYNDNRTISVEKTNIDVNSIGTKGDTVTSITRIVDPTLVVVSDYTTDDPWSNNDRLDWTGMTYANTIGQGQDYRYNKWGVCIAYLR